MGRPDPTALARITAEYAAEGWNIIPIGEDKRPATPGMVWAPYMDRQSTAEERELWFTYAQWNVGVVTGDISRLIVIDLDDERALEVVESTFDLTNYPVASTGRGVHIYVRMPEGRATGPTFTLTHPDFSGVHHVKANGGFVVAPPSIHPSGAVYTWINDPPSQPGDPDALVLAMVEAGFRRRERGADGIVPSGEYAELVRGTYGEGTRTPAMMALAGVLRQGFKSPALALEMLDSWNKEHCVPPVPRREVESMVASYYRRYQD